MAKGKGSIKGWITRNGVHIPIYGEYTVRGGVEPKAKGSKGWSKKKKREFIKNPISGKTEIKRRPDITKDLKKGYDEDSKETWYEGEVDGRRVRVLQEDVGSNKFWNVEIDGEKLRTDNDRAMSFENFDDASDEIAHTLSSKSESKAAKKISETGSNYLEERQNQAAAENAAEVRKTTNGDFSLEDYERRQQEKASKKIAAREDVERKAFRDKKAQEQGFADDASMRSYEEETGVNKETWKGQESSRYHDKMTTPYKDLNDKQKSFVKELAEERAGHKLSDEGVQFYQDLENDERSIRQTQIKERESKQLREIPKGQESSKIAANGASKSVNKNDVFNDELVANLKKNGKNYQKVSFEDFAGTNNDFRAAAERGGLNVEYDKDDDAFYLRKSSTNDTNAGSRYKTKQQIADASSTSFDGMASTIKGMSITGLKSALSKASGGEAAMIKSELRKRGYQLVGGKWTKKKS